MVIKLVESKSQKKATSNWNKKNKEHRSYLTSRSMARGFIKNKATLEDLEELSQLIEEKRKKLL